MKKTPEPPSCIYPAQIEAQVLELARVTRQRDLAKDDLDVLSDEITKEVLLTVEPTTGKLIFTNDKSRDIEIRKRQRESNDWITALNKYESEEGDRVHCAAILERLRGDFSVWKIEKREAIATLEAAA